MVNMLCWGAGSIWFPFQSLAPQVPALIFHHGLADDRLHALEDAQSVAQDIPEGQLLVEAVARWQLGTGIADSTSRHGG
jgi:hypothetical protein